MEEEEEIVVIDNGSASIKAGFAGDKAPRSVFTTAVGRPYGSSFLFEKDAWVGEEAVDRRAVLFVKYPVEHGIITNWDDMEKIWFHTFYNELRVTPEEHPVLLTEAPLNPEINRERMTQIMMEAFVVPAMSIHTDTNLSLYSSGRINGVVLDSGYQVTNCVPIYEGYALKDVMKSSKIGGKDLTGYLTECLNERGHSFKTKRDFKYIRDMKETFCYVSQNFKQDTEICLESSALEKNYKLPDETIVTLGTERFKCPEMLFSSNVEDDKLGLHELLQQSLLICDKEQRELFKSIVLSGGSSMFPGLGQRLKTEVSNIIEPDTNISIVENPISDRINSAWVGGSTLAALPVFKEMCITQEQYNEVGPSIFYRRQY